MTTTATMTNEQLIAELKQRVAGLYRLNKALSEHCDRQAKVVDAALRWRREGLAAGEEFAWRIDPLLEAIDDYGAEVEKLTKGGTG